MPEPFPLAKIGFMPNNEMERYHFIILLRTKPKHQIKKNTWLEGVGSKSASLPATFLLLALFLQRNGFFCREARADNQSGNLSRVEPSFLIYRKTYHRGEGCNQPNSYRVHTPVHKKR